MTALAAPLVDSPGEARGDPRTLDATFSEARTLERRADLGVLPAHGPAYRLEAQLSVDPETQGTWPSYVVLTRDQLRRDVVLVVRTFRDAVAAWARRPISRGPTGSCVVPVVIRPAELPLITDPTAALAHPERLVRSALAHGQGPAAAAIADLAAAVVVRLVEDRAGFHTDLILRALEAKARAALEGASRQNDAHQSDVARRTFDEGREAGRVEGKTELGHDMHRKILLQRGFSPHEAQVRRIIATQDPDLLTTWALCAVSAPGIDAVFAEDGARPIPAHASQPSSPRTAPRSAPSAMLRRCASWSPAAPATSEAPWCRASSRQATTSTWSTA